MPHLDFGEMCQVNLPDSNTAVDHINEYYEQLCRSGKKKQPVLVCEELTNSPEPEVVLGDTNQYFGRCKGGFVIQGGQNSVLIDESWNRMAITPETGMEFISEILEYVIRRRLAEKGFAMGHCSGVRYDGSTALFHGWRHSGKTNTLLTLLAEGADYLGDDRLWVGADGGVIGLPLRVHLTPSNADLVPGGGDESRFMRWYGRTEQRIHNRMADDPSLIERGIYYFLQNNTPMTGHDYKHVDELFPSAEYVEHSSVDVCFMLRVDPDAEADDISIEEMDRHKLVRELTSTSFYEWDQSVSTYVHAFQALYPENDELKNFNRMRVQERRVFETLADEIEIYRLSLPQIEDWRTEGICQILLSRLRPYL